MAELARFQGTFGFDVMRRELARRQSDRDADQARVAAITPAQRKRESARKLIQDEGGNGHTRYCARARA